MQTDTMRLMNLESVVKHMERRLTLLEGTERSEALQGCPPSANGCPEARADGLPGADSSVRCPEAERFSALANSWRLEAAEWLRVQKAEGESMDRSRAVCYERQLRLCASEVEAILAENARQRSGERVLPGNI